jgi:hypothetical protein
MAIRPRGVVDLLGWRVEQRIVQDIQLVDLVRIHALRLVVTVGFRLLGGIRSSKPLIHGVVAAAAATPRKRVHFSILREKGMTTPPHLRATTTCRLVLLFLCSKALHTWHHDDT